MNEPGAPNATIHDLTPITDPRERRRDPTERFMEALEAKEREKARIFWIRVKIWVPVVLTILGGGTYAGLQLKPADAPPVLPSDLKDDVKKATDLSQENARKIRALGKVTVEGLDYLGRKIDTAHPEVRVVEKPESLKDAEKALENTKLEDKVDELLGGTDGM